MLEDDPFKILDGREKKKNQGSRASLVIHNNSRVSSPRLITLGASCNARGRRSVFELVRLSSQADENELAEEDTYSRLSVVRVRACVRAREEREKSSRTRPSGRKNLKRAQQPSSRDRSTRKKQRGRRRKPACSKSLGQIIFETRLHRASGCAADAELWIRHAQGAQREESRVLPEHVSAFHAPLTLASDSIARNLAV